MSKQNWFLKILSGAHIGAEIDLEEGTYAIGQHEECDFILTDQQLADKQFTISVTAGQIKLNTEHDTPFIIDGETIGNTCEPEKHQLIQIAGLNLVLGLSGEALPDLSSSLSSNTQTNKPREPVKNNDSDPQESMNDMKEEESPIEEKKHIDGKIPILDSNQPSKASEKISPKNSNNAFLRIMNTGWERVQSKLLSSPIFLKNKKNIYILISIILLMILLYVFYPFIQNHQDNSNNPPILPESIETAQIKTANLFEKVEEIITELGFSEIQIQKSNGMLTIRGYVSTVKDYHQLLEQFKQAKIAYKSQIIILQNMLISAQKALDHNELNIKAHLGVKSGSIRLTGYVENLSKVKGLEDLLLSEVLGLESVKIELETRMSRLTKLKDSLKQANVFNELTKKEDQHQFVLSGSITDQHKFIILKSIISEFKKQYKNEPNVTLDVKLNVLDIKKIDINLGIRSISLGREPYIILSDNEKYIIGAKLQNRYILESIGLDYLVLRIDDQRIKYYVRNEHG